MSNEHESMIGILKLYELRSEETMRKARDWFATVFHPESTQDILNVRLATTALIFGWLLHIGTWRRRSSFSELLTMKCSMP